MSHNLKLFAFEGKGFLIYILLLTRFLSFKGDESNLNESAKTMESYLREVLFWKIELICKN